jgi:selenide, water dikinase
LGPADLRTLVSRLPPVLDPALLVGIETGDDAAVYRITPELAMVQTLDFFMPVVDDPYDYGRIAAANSISDVYAMGGRPILALAIVGMPVKKFSPEVMALVLEGGAAVCKEAGISIVGGHSIDDEEPKFGLVVSGLVHPDKVLRNSGAQAGDWLVLTKPLGSGTLAHAVKKGVITPEAYGELVRVATFLNRIPAEAAQAVGVHAATDVTGFGLLGHAHGMAKGSGLTAELWCDALPVIDGARENIAAGMTPGAVGRNLSFFDVHFAEGVDEADKKLVADPQTSGGLLFAVAPDKKDALVAELEARGALCAAIVGRMVAPGAAVVEVRRR